MLTALRHLLAILLLPVVMTIVVPFWLRSRFDLDTRGSRHCTVGRDARAWRGRAARGRCAVRVVRSLFARVGRGTLAPWDPTQRLVAVGPYRYLRNPMITGVATVLAGQALLTGSWILAAWMLAFVAVNFVYFVTVEEPGLERRFGDPYREYKARVPRWMPRRPPR